VLRLSPENYSGTSIAAVGIAAHESGHAIQDAQRYAPLVIRNIAVPAASIGSTFGWLAVVIGAAMSTGGHISAIAWIGMLLLGAVVFFQLINLPVEFDASRRALQVLPATGILTPEENQGARSVLSAAARRTWPQPSPRSPSSSTGPGVSACSAATTGTSRAMPRGRRAGAPGMEVSMNRQCGCAVGAGCCLAVIGVLSLLSAEEAGGGAVFEPAPGRGRVDSLPRGEVPLHAVLQGLADVTGGRVVLRTTDPPETKLSSRVRWTRSMKAGR
jgi:hypothetical protein